MNLILSWLQKINNSMWLEESSYFGVADLKNESTELPNKRTSSIFLWDECSQPLVLTITFKPLFYVDSTPSLNSLPVGNFSPRHEMNNLFLGDP
jgi:hypothetical protein